VRHLKNNSKSKLLDINLYGDIDFNSIETSEKAIKIMREKKCLRNIYEEMYQYMMKVSTKMLSSATKKPRILEIGSGGGFIKDIFPDIITSDVKKLSNVDMVIDAETLPFEDESVDKIFAVHVIHHIPDIEKFIKEALRVLKPDGGIVCIEPYWSPVARLLYKKLHPEPFDEKMRSWTFSSNGPMTGSNQALSYILLKRDKVLFDSSFPELKVIRLKKFGFIRYFCTGGIWLKQKLPDFCFPILKFAEIILTPLMPLLAIHHCFILKKCLK
jgi:SAM-dependent methyltransferase